VLHRTLAWDDCRRDIVRVKKNNAPSAADLIFAIVVPVTAIYGTVKLTQSDGDLSAHIRMGETILSTHQIPTHSLSSYTAAADFMVAHAWLSEIIFALLFRWGGLPLISVVAGILVGLTHGSIAVFLRRKGADPRWAFVAALVSLALASTHWLARPHMFSIVGATATLFLLDYRSSRRAFLCLPLFVLWTNLHGGWLYGLTMIGCFVIGDLGEALLSRDDERREWLNEARINALALVCGLAGTLLNPYGLTLHREVFSAVTDTSLANNIGEFLPPNFQDAYQWPFLLALIGTVALFALGTKRIQLPWLALILVSLFFALRSFRNIALFGVSAWPLVALHASRSLPPFKRPVRLFSEFARLDPGSRMGILAIPVTILMLVLGLNHGRVATISLIPDQFSPKAFPTLAVAKAKAANLPGRVFDAWRWGGYIMYAWPEARLHVDPLKFNRVTIKSYSMIEDMQPGWQNELDLWQIKTVIINSKSPLAKGLGLEPKWKVWYRDSTAVVFRPAADPAL
jgi:flagellar biogenesis protein FliO